MVSIPWFYKGSSCSFSEYRPSFPFRLMASSLNRSMFLALLCFFLRFCSLGAYNVPFLPRGPRCSGEDLTALLEFKHSFVLANVSRDPLAYPKTTYWRIAQNESVADCCKWEGVGCDARDGHVTFLDLSSSYLYGSIDSTSSLFKLVHLQRLSLADNHFNYSRIPYGFCQMTRLTHLNLSLTSFSGQVPSDILTLTRLVSLDLSGLVELKNPGLESLVRNLTNLQVLGLNYVTISAPVPIALSNLSSLRQLFLWGCGLYGTFPSQVFQLPNLESINLAMNRNLTGHLPEFNSSSPLKWLGLVGTKFSGELPVSITNLRNLEILDLNSEDCNFSGSLPSSMGNLQNLKYLDIAGCKFSGSIPSSIGNLTGLNTLALVMNPFAPQELSSLSWLYKMTNLTTLALVNISLQGRIPSSIGNLSGLVLLSLPNNQLNGPLPPQMSNLTQLQILCLQHNNLSGPLPPQMLDLTRLQYLFLGRNNVSGPIPSWLMNMTHLTGLDLSSNRFEGEIPPTFSQMVNLQGVLLLQNDLTGTVELDTFLKLKNLNTLQLSFNRLSVIANTTTQIADAPQLQALGLASCNLGEFPGFLQHQQILDWIDLSDNNIHGQVPDWIWSLSYNRLEFMNLSRNFLTGSDSDPPFLPHIYLNTLDLSHNKFKRPIPAPPKSILYYLISRNELEGEIPSYFCELSKLVALDFSFNNMSGILPSCLGHVSGNLSILNLQSNGFHGRIPEFLASGNRIVMIELSDNRLEGKLPSSMANCTMLEFIGLANNRISDTFPHWLGSLPELKVLILSSNKFHGSIDKPRSEPVFRKLRIIDLSNNDFSGGLPGEYFRRWTSMKTVNSSTNQLEYLQHNLQPHGYLLFTYYAYYDFAMTVTYKGRKIPYPKISDVLTIVDFSSNLFHGTIPDTVGELKGLQGLNFSNNLLTGHIPFSLGNLTVLESLDLSNNKLSGGIPLSLADITFLAILNLSDNDLTGPIPKGTQFDNFPSTSFEGNPGLCGENIPKKCHDSGGGGLQPRQFPNTHEGGDPTEILGNVFWIIVAMGCGSGFFVGWVLGNIFASWKRAWFEPSGRRARRRRIKRRN